MLNKENLIKICEYMLKGLTEDEACLLCDIDPSILREKKEENEIIRNMVEKSRVNFKLAHLEEIQKKKSEKNSMWMLEKILPNEFGNKAKDNSPVNVNIISQIIQSIQNGEESSRIIPRTRGEFIAASESNEEDRPRLEVGSILK